MIYLAVRSDSKDGFTASLRKRIARMPISTIAITQGSSNVLKVHRHRPGASFYAFTLLRDPRTDDKNEASSSVQLPVNYGCSVGDVNSPSTFSTLVTPPLMEIGIYARTWLAVTRHASNTAIYREQYVSRRRYRADSCTMISE